jgi:hypothetical protein
MAVKVTFTGGKLDLQKIARDAVKKVAEAAAGRVRQLRCDVHRESPKNVRVEPNGATNFRVVASYCCDALGKKATRAISDSK